MKSAFSTLTVVVLFVALSGCSAVTGIPQETSSPTTTGVCENPPAAPQEPVPEKPSSLTESNVADFVVAYEEATTHNVMAENGSWNIYVGVTANVTSVTDDGYVVHVEGTAEAQRCLDDVGAVYADGIIQKSYFVNETVTISQQTENATADPRSTH